MDEILHLEKEFKSKIDQSDNLYKIEQVKSEAFGKNGKIGELFKKITTLQGEDKKLLERFIQLHKLLMK